MTNELMKIVDNREEDIRDLKSRIRHLRIAMEHAVCDCEKGYIINARNGLLHALRNDYSIDIGK